MTPSKNQLRQLITYDPDTGIVKWRSRDRGDFKSKQSYESWQEKKAGKLVGKEKVYAGGYRIIKVCLFSREHCLHRLIWTYVTGEKPPLQIDHINRDATDNSWQNLRDGSKVNRYNLSLYKNNKSGISGVHWDGYHKRWVAVVTHNKVAHHLGKFREPDDAKRAVIKFRERHGGFSEGHGAPRASAV